MFFLEETVEVLQLLPLSSSWSIRRTGPETTMHFRTTAPRRGQGTGKSSRSHVKQDGFKCPPFTRHGAKAFTQVILFNPAKASVGTLLRLQVSK